MSSSLLIIAGAPNSYNLYGWGTNGYNQFGYDSGSISFQPLALLNSSASITQIAARGRAMLALDSAGQVWAWGDNTDGSVGNNTTSNTISSPVVVLSNVTQISSYGLLCAAVKNDNTVWVWGRTFNGLNGVATTTYSSPVQLTTISNVAQVEVAGGDNAPLGIPYAQNILYRKTDGTVWAQGDNFNGQLGDSSTTYRSSPVQVTGFSNATKIGVGNFTNVSYALKSDGTLWSWGSNSSGAAGSGVTVSSPTQVRYSTNGTTNSGALTDIIDIFPGAGNCFAINSNYQLYGWGRNDIYQVTDQWYPVGPGLNMSYAVLINQFFDTNGNLILGGVSTVQVCASQSSVMSIDSNGKLFSWGFNDVGQAGNSFNGALQTISKPIQVNSETNWSKLGCSVRLSSSTYGIAFQANYALKTDGTVYGTGRNLNYNFTRLNTVYSPTQVGTSQFLEFANGNNFSVAIGGDKKLYTVGTNIFGQLGTTISYVGPDPITRQKWWYTFLQISANDWKKVAAGSTSGYAIRSDNTLWAWGYNDKGQLGDGTVTTRSSPVQVISTSLVSPVTVAAGWKSAFAVDSNGLVWSWGDNQLGQLGINTWSPGDYRVSPLAVINDTPPAQLSNIVQISCAYTNTMALDSSGKIWAWGYNNFGGLGVGPIGVSSPQDTAIESTLGLYILLNGVPIQIASGQYHSLALSSDGTVWAVGYNAFGQLGDLTTTNRSAAVQVLGISNIVSIGASGLASFALQSDGKLWAWGQNVNSSYPDAYIGTLGVANNTTAYSSPVLVGTYPKAYQLTANGPSAFGYKTLLVKPY